MNDKLTITREDYDALKAEVENISSVVDSVTAILTAVANTVENISTDLANEDVDVDDKVTELDDLVLQLRNKASELGNAAQKKTPADPTSPGNQPGTIDQSDYLSQPDVVEDQNQGTVEEELPQGQEFEAPVNAEGEQIPVGQQETSPGVSVDNPSANVPNEGPSFQQGETEASNQQPSGGIPLEGDAQNQNQTPPSP